jgi:hypothetical protein
VKDDSFAEWLQHKYLCFTLTFFGRDGAVSYSTLAEVGTERVAQQNEPPTKDGFCV